MLSKIIILFFRLFLYKSLFFFLNIFQNLLFEKHFYLFNKFLNLYTTSAVSTESKKLPFVHNSDIHDELYGDSNSFFSFQKYLYYFKNYNKLIFNIVNFRKLLAYRQYYRALFFFKYNHKIQEKFRKNKFFFFNKFSVFNKNLSNIKFFDILKEKYKLIYINKNYFSYMILFFEFTFLIINNFFYKYIIIKKKKKLLSFLQKPNKNFYYSKNYWEYIRLRQIFFDQYLNILNDYNKQKNVFKFKNNFLFVKYFKVNIKIFFFIKPFLILIIILNYIFFMIFNLFLKFKFLTVINFFFINMFRLSIKTFFSSVVKFLNFCFFKIRNIFTLNFKNLKNIFYYIFYISFFCKFYYYIEYKIFTFFVDKINKLRNFSYLEILGILFIIKNDLKIRQKNLLNQTKTRQIHDFKDIDIHEFVNNVLPEEKNHDFFFFSKFLKKKIKNKNFDFSKRRRFFNSTKLVNRKLNFNFKLTKVFKKVNFKTKFINLYYKDFFFKYSFLLNNYWFFFSNYSLRNNDLFYFYFRRLFYYKSIIFSKIKTHSYFLNFENYFKIKYFKLSTKYKLKNLDLTTFIQNFLIFKKKKKIKNKKIILKKKYVKLFKYLKKKKHRYSYKIFFKLKFLNQNLILKRKNFKIKKITKKKSKKIKIFYLLKLFKCERTNFETQQNYIFLKKKRKYIRKKNMNFRKKILNYHKYKSIRKRTKLNFVNFFEQNENTLINQKKYSLFLSNYGLNRNLSWFTDFHDYTFFHKYFILKRDRFWYSIAKRETLKKFHQGRNMLSDSWEQNYEIQQKSVYFLKEKDNSLFYSRNGLINFYSLKFLELMKQTALKKHFAFIFFTFFFKLFFFINISFFFFFNTNNFFCLLLFLNVICFTVYPFICFLYLKYFQYKYKFIRICILLNFRKPYIYKASKKLLLFKIFTFYFNYISNFFFKKKFIYKNLYILGFLGKLFNIKYCSIKTSSMFPIYFFNLIGYIFIYVFIYIYLINYELYIYQFLYFLNKQTFIFLLFFFSFLIYKCVIFIFNLFFFKLIKKRYINDFFFFLILKLYFQNDNKKFVIFIDLFLNTRYSLINFNNLLEQFNILQSIKNLQYLTTYKKLKKNAL